MTKQNRIHKVMCKWEQYRKGCGKTQRKYRCNIPKNHKRHNRKFWWQWDKDFNAKWRKENEK